MAAITVLIIIAVVLWPERLFVDLFALATACGLSWLLLRWRQPDAQVALWRWVHGRAPLHGIVALLATWMASLLIVSGLLDRSGAQEVWFTTTTLVAATLVPAAFLGFGVVTWPDRCASVARSQPLLFALFAFGLATVVTVALIMSAETEIRPASLGELAVLSLATVTLAAAEEVTFRGLLLTALFQLSRSRVDALLLSTAVFSLFHAPAELWLPFLNGDWPMLASWIRDYAPSFLWQNALGLVLGALWLRTGSFFVIVGAHAVFNVAAMLLDGF